MVPLFRAALQYYGRNRFHAAQQQRAGFLLLVLCVAAHGRAAAAVWVPIATSPSRSIAITGGEFVSVNVCALIFPWSSGLLSHQQASKLG